jgi:hypothetical protein
MQVKKPGSTCKHLKLVLALLITQECFLPNTLAASVDFLQNLGTKKYERSLQGGGKPPSTPGNGCQNGNNPNCLPASPMRAPVKPSPVAPSPKVAPSKPSPMKPAKAPKNLSPMKPVTSPVKPTPMKPSKPVKAPVKPSATPRKQPSAKPSRKPSIKPKNKPSVKPSTNVILEWNDVAMQIVIADFTKSSTNQSCSRSPPATALQLAKAHLAMYDALGSVLEHGRDPYLLYVNTSSYQVVSYEAAVATAAHHILLNSYPAQQQVLNDAYDTTMKRLNLSMSSLAIANGKLVGNAVVDAYISNRTNDNSCPMNMTYTWRNGIGQHQPDPTHPNQGIVAPNYGDVSLFVKASSSIELKPPPQIESNNYTFVFNQVKRLGGDNITTAADRQWQESVAAWYYAYDGAPYLGPPPVLMNSVVREIMGKSSFIANSTVVKEKGYASSEVNAISAAYILAQVHTAMADAGILTWKQKYLYNFWRPINAIRNASNDGNSQTAPALDWIFLGAPRSNPPSPGQTNFDPAFPSHASGHASFCGAAMKSLGNILQTNNVEYKFVSWEWNGTTTDELGIVRPNLYQEFDTLSEFASLCGASRVWAGVHFATDCQEGQRLGYKVADNVYENSMKWKQGGGKLNLPAIKTDVGPEEEVMLYLNRERTVQYLVDGKSENEVKGIVMDYFGKRQSLTNKMVPLNQVIQPRRKRIGHDWV